MEEMYIGKNTIAIPPGETIKEQLEMRDMTQKELAVRMDMSEKHISHLLNGKVELTPGTALRLETVLGIPASFWMKLESNFREKLARVAEENAAEQEESLAKKFPYAEMAKEGWVPKVKTAAEKVINLRKFFEVARLDVIENLRIPGIAYRTKGENETSDYRQAAWAQKARLEAKSCSVASIDIDKLKGYVSRIRKLTVYDPSVFCDKLRSYLADCGIVIVFLPHISGSFVHGASFVDGDHIVLGMTVRGRDADKFWFSLFHELHHILQGDILSDCTTKLRDEAAADAFATNTLIDPGDYEYLLSQRLLTKVTITRFARQIGIDPGIVVGRLQNDGIVPHSRFNDLKKKYAISARQS